MILKNILERDRGNPWFFKVGLTELISWELLVFIKKWVIIYCTKCFIIVFVWNGNVYPPILGISSMCRSTSYFIFDLLLFNHWKILVNLNNLNSFFSFSFDLKYFCKDIFSPTVLLPRLQCRAQTIWNFGARYFLHLV